MFREMRRKKQQLCTEECVRLLERGTSGVLAVSGDDGYPYAVPLSYVYSEGKIYFHCAVSGHKLDAIKRDDKVSFCVVDRDEVVPDEYTTYFRSVIVFGRARALNSDTEIRASLDVLAKKYRPGHEPERKHEIEGSLGHVCIIELEIEHISGKEAIELAKQRAKE